MAALEDAAQGGLVVDQKVTRYASDNATPSAAQADIAVFRYGRRIGLVRARPSGQFEAILAASGSLGWFTSSWAAARAVLAMAHTAENGRLEVARRANSIGATVKP
jgi:hypothetical protein